MNIKQARYITSYEKVCFSEWNYGEECEYCKLLYTRHNSCNELKTSYEYDECVI